MTRFLLVGAALALVTAACSGDAAVTTTTTTTAAATPVATPTTTSTSTTMAATTTTVIDPETTVTTIPADFASPINGLSPSQDNLLDQGVVGVKIDNHPRARPQSGVMDADMVIEIRVEGGLTRFIAIFHDNESEYLGPTRSVRPTDSTVLAPLDAPLAMSGGQPWIQRLHSSRSPGLISTDSYGFRISGKVAPHNLYTSTELARQGAADLGISDDPPPGSLYAIVQWDIPDTTADKIVLDYSDGVTVTWDWDEDNANYVRTHNDVLHEIIDEEGNPTSITTEVLVILAGEFYTEFPPPEDSDWQAVPATDTLGAGEAWVFSRGAVWEGVWQRSSYSDPFTLLNDDGSEAGVPPGVSWVSIFPEHRPVTWE